MQKHNQKKIRIFGAIFAAVLIFVAIPGFVYALEFAFIYGSGFDAGNEGQAVVQAASGSYNIIKDDVVVKVKLEWVDDASIDGAVASTDPNTIWTPYPLARKLLERDEEDEISRNGLVRILPQLQDFDTDESIKYWITVGGVETPAVHLTQAQWKALGLTKEDFFPESGHCDSNNTCWDDNQDATIYFNRSNFSQYHGKSENPDSRDLGSIAKHELGHVLGFNSATDMGTWAGPTPLDLFRFQGGNIPDTLDKFRTNRRNLTTTLKRPETVLNYNLSDGSFYSEPMTWRYKNHQASHWINRTHPNEIGIMDPGQPNSCDKMTLAADGTQIDDCAFEGEIVSTYKKLPDNIALDLIGWDVHEAYFDILDFVPLFWYAIDTDTSPKVFNVRDVYYSLPSFLLMKDLQSTSLMIASIRDSTEARRKICEIIDCSDLISEDEKVSRFFENTTASQALPIFYLVAASPQKANLVHADYPVSNNELPVCDAGGPYQGECGKNIALDGTGTYDPDEDSIDYTWQGEFPGGVVSGEQPIVKYFNTGQSPVMLTAKDALDEDLCFSEVTVSDTLPPSVTADQIPVMECTSPDGTPVDLGQNAAEDLCDGPLAATNNGLGLYPLGTTEVTWTATDTSGNIGTYLQNVVVVDTRPPVLTVPPDATAECASPNGTSIVLGEATAEDVCDGNLAATNDGPAFYPLGSTPVTWTSKDSSGNQNLVVQNVTIEDTVAPSIGVSVSPDVLWPPNHKLVEITPSVITGDQCCGSNVTVSLLSINMNEGDSEDTYDPTFDTSTEAGQAQGDIQIIDGKIFLRAERGGKSNGRIYTLTYQVEDCASNSKMGVATVTVPHNM